MSGRGFPGKYKVPPKGRGGDAGKAYRRALQEFQRDSKVLAETEYFFQLTGEATTSAHQSTDLDEAKLFTQHTGSVGIDFDKYDEIPVERSEEQQGDELRNMVDEAVEVASRPGAIPIVEPLPAAMADMTAFNKVLLMEWQTNRANKLNGVQRLKFDTVPVIPEESDGFEHGFLGESVTRDRSQHVAGSLPDDTHGQKASPKRRGHRGGRFTRFLRGCVSKLTGLIDRRDQPDRVDSEATSDSPTNNQERSMTELFGLFDAARSSTMTNYLSRLFTAFPSDISLIDIIDRCTVSSMRTGVFQMSIGEVIGLKRWISATSSVLDTVRGIWDRLAGPFMPSSPVA